LQNPKSNELELTKAAGDMAKEQFSEADYEKMNGVNIWPTLAQLAIKKTQPLVGFAFLFQTKFRNRLFLTALAYWPNAATMPLRNFNFIYLLIGISYIDVYIYNFIHYKIKI
jgi:hypothetical protein